MNRRGEARFKYIIVTGNDQSRNNVNVTGGRSQLEGRSSISLRLVLLVARAGHANDKGLNRGPSRLQSETTLEEVHEVMGTHQPLKTPTSRPMVTTYQESVEGRTRL